MVAVKYGKASKMVESGDALASGSTDNELSSHSNSELSLQYSSSPFEGHSSPPESDEEFQPEESTIEPYMYEPENSGDEEAEDSSDDDSRTDRLDNNDW